MVQNLRICTPLFAYRIQQYRDRSGELQFYINREIITALLFIHFLRIFLFIRISFRTNRCGLCFYVISMFCTAFGIIIVFLFSFLLLPNLWFFFMIQILVTALTVRINVFPSVEKSDRLEFQTRISFAWFLFRSSSIYSFIIIWFLHYLCVFLCFAQFCFIHVHFTLGK